MEGLAYSKLHVSNRYYYQEQGWLCNLQSPVQNKNGGRALKAIIKNCKTATTEQWTKHAALGDCLVALGSWP